MFLFIYMLLSDVVCMTQGPGQHGTRLQPSADACLLWSERREKREQILQREEIATLQARRDVM